MPRPRIVCVALTIAVLLGLGLGPALGAGPVPRMEPEELKGRLGSRDLVIIDTRLEGDWGASQGKIAKAVREDPRNVAAWAGKYPKGATIVVYCA
ncbi:hypothetical protein JCM30394_14810 [Deferrisoma palaeochoriense]